MFNYNGIARLKPGITIAQANEDVARVWKTWGVATGASKMLDMVSAQPNLRPLKRDVVGDVGSVLSVIMGALGLVLLLVCANVANLVLVRAQSRREEFAIRAAIGAGWERIARGLLWESLVLGVLAGSGGVALAYVGVRILVTYGPVTPSTVGRDFNRWNSPCFCACLLARIESAVRTGCTSQMRNA